MLAKNHPLSTMYIRDCHLQVLHLGLQSTLNKLRTSGFWLINSRNYIKIVLKECKLCIKYNQFSFNYRKFTNFTKKQMEFFIPFQHCGVDYTFHVWVRHPTSGKSLKFYIIIYLDLNIRCCFLDLVPSMSTKDFLLSFLLFVNMYTIPNYLVLQIRWQYTGQFASN